MSDTSAIRNALGGYTEKQNQGDSATLRSTLNDLQYAVRDQIYKLPYPDTAPSAPAQPQTPPQTPAPTPTPTPQQVVYPQPTTTPSAQPTPQAGGNWFSNIVDTFAQNITGGQQMLGNLPMPTGAPQNEYLPKPVADVGGAILGLGQSAVQGATALPFIGEPLGQLGGAINQGFQWYGENINTPAAGLGSAALEPLDRIGATLSGIQDTGAGLRQALQGNPQPLQQAFQDIGNAWAQPLTNPFADTTSADTFQNTVTAFQQGDYGKAARSLVDTLKVIGEKEYAALPPEEQLAASFALDPLNFIPGFGIGKLQKGTKLAELTTELPRIEKAADLLPKGLFGKIGTPVAKVTETVKSGLQNVLLRTTFTRDADEMFAGLRAFEAAGKDAKGFDEITKVYAGLKSVPAQRGARLIQEFGPIIDDIERGYRALEGGIDAVTDLKKLPKTFARFAEDVKAGRATADQLLEVTQAEIATRLQEHMAGQAAKLFPQKAGGAVRGLAGVGARFLNELKGAEALVYIGLSPVTFVKNIVNGVTTMMIEGVNPLFDAGREIKRLQKLGKLEMADDLQRAVRLQKTMIGTGGAVRKAFGEGQFATGATGAFGSFMSKMIQGTPVGAPLRWYEGAERSMRAKVWTNTYYKAMLHNWDAGAWIPKLDAATEVALHQYRIDPNDILNLVREAGPDKGKILKNLNDFMDGKRGAAVNWDAVAQEMGMSKKELMSFLDEHDAAKASQMAEEFAARRAAGQTQAQAANDVVAQAAKETADATAARTGYKVSLGTDSQLARLEENIAEVEQRQAGLMVNRKIPKANKAEWDSLEAQRNLFLDERRALQEQLGYTDEEMLFGKTAETGTPPEAPAAPLEPKPQEPPPGAPPVAEAAPVQTDVPSAQTDIRAVETPPSSPAFTVDTVRARAATLTQPTLKPDLMREWNALRHEGEAENIQRATQRAVNNMSPDVYLEKAQKWIAEGRAKGQTWMDTMADMFEDRAHYILDQVKQGNPKYATPEMMDRLANGDALTKLLRGGDNGFDWTKFDQPFEGRGYESFAQYRQRVGATPRPTAGTGSASVGAEGAGAGSGAAVSPTTGAVSRAGDVGAKAEPRVVSFEEFAAQKGYEKIPFGEDLHRQPRATESSRKAASQELLRRGRNNTQILDEAKKEYDALVASGQIRPPTHLEELQKAASLNPESAQAQAAKRVLEKRAARLGSPTAGAGGGVADVAPKLGEVSAEERLMNWRDAVYQNQTKLQQAKSVKEKAKYKALLEQAQTMVRKTEREINALPSPAPVAEVAPAPVAEAAGGARRLLVEIPEQPAKSGHAFSIAFESPDGKYNVNWAQYFKSDDIDWDKVLGFADERGYRVYLQESPHKVGGAGAGVAKKRTLVYDAKKPAPVAEVAPAPVAETAGGANFRTWRVQGGTVRHARPSMKLTEQEAQSILALMKQNGMRGTYDANKGIINMNAGTSSDLTALWEKYGSNAIKEEKAGAARRAVVANKEAAAAERGTALASTPETVNWIDNVFGADAMNDTNKLELSRFLNGESRQFQGLPNPKWKEGLEKLDALDGNKIDWGKIKRAYTEKGAGRTTTEIPFGPRNADQVLIDEMGRQLDAINEIERLRNIAKEDPEAVRILSRDEIVKSKARTQADMYEALYNLWSREDVKYVRLGSDAKNRVMSWARRDVMRAADDAHMGATVAADWMDNAVMISRDGETVFDAALSVLSPFQFWRTRFAAETLRRVADKPGRLAFYMNLRNAADQVHNDPRYPKRLQGKTFIPVPWVPQWAGGGLWGDIPEFFTSIKQVFNLDDFQDEVTDAEVASSIRALASRGELSTTEAANAIANQSGALWDATKQRLMELAKSNKGGEALSDMFRPHLPLDIIWKLKTGTADEIGVLFPMTRLIRGATSMLPQGNFLNPTGQGINIEQPLKAGLRALTGDQSIPDWDMWEEYRTDRALADMVGEGLLTERDAMIAMIERRGTFFDRARMRAQEQMRDQNYSFFGGQIFPEGEKQYYKSKVLLNQLLDQSVAQLGANPLDFSNGEKWDLVKANGLTKRGTPLGDFYQQHPEYTTRQSVYDEPEARLKGFLIDELWNKYYSVGALDRRLMGDDLGETFQKLFRNKDTRDLSSVTLDQIGEWVRKARAYVPEQPIIKVGDFPPVRYATPDQNQRYQAMQDQRDMWFNMDDLSPKLDTYHKMSREDGMDYRARNPDLDGYLKWYAAQMRANPDLSKLLSPGYQQKSYELDSRYAQNAVTRQAVANLNRMVNRIGDTYARRYNPRGGSRGGGAAMSAKVKQALAAKKANPRYYIPRDVYAELLRLFRQSGANMPFAQWLQMMVAQGG